MHNFLMMGQILAIVHTKVVEALSLCSGGRLSCLILSMQALLWIFTGTSIPITFSMPVN